MAMPLPMKRPVPMEPPRPIITTCARLRPWTSPASRPVIEASSKPEIPPPQPSCNESAAGARCAGLGVHPFVRTRHGALVGVAAGGAGEVGLFRVAKGDAAVPHAQVQGVGD